ncbi:unnamed protein product [Sordaria macrospora k-hell]|uniref:WGS project CABT00000000 data, contig 2.16 n=2 Tax=Sordaria macrospora TaxID=5147 RepID=F7VZX6_SORMK|nr:uncharacterized protein SMAC_03782 [Sordaria macrospora k-hell]CCC11075.1 unnamed protein product [Sordaria macrospora k-hell]
MTVKDDVYHATENLILPKPRRRYRTSVHPSHWQLRSMVGVEGNDIVYFPGGRDSTEVQRLNTTTQEIETIKRLPFQPRCLVARNGWICCGGETGEFTAIHVRERSPQNDANAPLNTGSDDQVPGQELLDELSHGLDDEDPVAVARALAREHILIAARGNANNDNKNLSVTSKKFGKQRVNCITLWFPPTLVPAAPGAYNEPIAVLSNNDNSVACVSLWEEEALDEIAYPDCVNRAVISPDGRLLIAISDDPYLYVHERVEKDEPWTNSYRLHRTHKWVLLRKVPLKSQSKDDRSENRGSFAACFSSTGNYLAIGTQYGIISVFDVAAFSVSGLDPLITSFGSSRPHAELGAIRDMAFAPGSADLLAWTEDRGHVGVADLRTGFISRQILDLDQRDDYDHVMISDRSAIDPRLLLLAAASSDEHEVLASASSTRILEALEAAGRRHRSNREHRDSLASGPFAPNELEVLDAMRAERRERDAANSGGGGGTATGRRTNTSIWRDDPSTRSGGGAGAGDTQQSSGSSEQSSRERGSGDLRTARDANRTLSTYREYADVVTGVPRRAATSLRTSASTGAGATGGGSTYPDRNIQMRANIQALREADDQATAADHLRILSSIARLGAGGERGDRIHPPNRTAGITGTTTNNNQTQTASDVAAERRALTLSSRIMANPSLLSPTSRNIASNISTNTNTTNNLGAAATLQQLYYTLGLEDTIPYDSFSRTLPELDGSARRLRHASLREWDDHPTRRAFGALYMSRREPDPHDTAGLCWSEDGRVL